MEKKKLGGCCCRVFIVFGIHSIEELSALARDSFASALRGSRRSLDSLKFFALLDPLPSKYEDWLEDSKQALPKDIFHGQQRFRCKALGADGFCGIYPRRPSACSDFLPNPGECSRCANWQDFECKPPAPETERPPAKGGL